MIPKGQACCSSPTAMYYWCMLSLLAWGVLSLIGIYWYPLHAASAATICLAVAFGCAANWFKNRTLHCAITGPVFLVAGSLFLLSEIDVFRLNATLLWFIVADLAGLAFLLELRFAARTSGGSAVPIPEESHE